LLKNKIRYITLAVAGLSLPVMAQVPATFNASIEQAILQNPEVRLRFQSLEASKSEQRAAEGGWLPRVDLQASGGKERYDSPTTGQALTFSHPSASLQIRQLIFDGFATSSEIRRLGHRQQAAYYELRDATNQIALEAGRAYIDVLRYRDLVELAKVNYAAHAELHAQLTSRVNSGVGRRVDLEQSAGRLALAESNWLTEASNLHDVSARYQRLVGDIPAASLGAVPELKQLLPAREKFMLEAIKENPAFLGAISTIRANRADADVRRANNYPTLEFRASDSVERNQLGTSGTFRDSAVQVVLNYNLFRGGADTARIRQQESQVNAAYELRDKACRDIRQTAQIAYNDVSRLTTQLGFLSQHELSTSKARDAYRQQFDIGQRSLLDLLDTENELFEARRSLTNGEYDLQLAKVRVLSSASRLLSALKLSPLQSEAPTQGGDIAEDDSLLRCSTELPPVLTLDKDSLPKPAFSMKDVTLPPIPDQKTPAKATPSADCLKAQETVNQWLGAWNQKDWTAMSAFYGDSFVPPQGVTRSAWSDMRKTRVSKPGAMQVTLKNLQTPQCDGKTAQVSFVQHYDSTDYHDVVEKVLSLELGKEGWKIVREAVTKGKTS